jgi:RNA polymerase sigma factor (sigma-70 family)
MGIPELDAEEVAQETLLKVYSNVGKFRRREEANFTTWVFQIAKNLAIDFDRKCDPTQQLTDDDLGPAGQDGELAHRNRPYLMWLADELTNLPSDVQSILRWRAAGSSYKDIGQELGIRPATARMKYMRGKNRLIEAANRSGLADMIVTQDEVESGVLYE